MARRTSWVWANDANPKAKRESEARSRFELVGASRRGFSLVELLVVIAVIVILIALLFPAVQASRASSRTVKCASQLQQVGAALARGKLDRIAGVPALWTANIAPYIDSARMVLHCPDDTTPAASDGTLSVSYGLSSRAAWLQGGDSQKILAVEYKLGVANVIGPQGTDNWPANVAVRHRNQLNVLDADGSVQLCKSSDIDPQICEIHDRLWRPTHDFAMKKPGCTIDVGLMPLATTTGSATSTTSSTTSSSTTTTSTTTTTTTGGTMTGGGCSGFTQIVDDPTATYVDTWTDYAAGYNNNFKYHAGGGTGTKSATWTFNGLVPGQYQVSATWAAFSIGATNAPYIITGDSALPAVRVNQVNPPAANIVVGGVNFQNLATVTITGSTISVKLTDDANNYVFADAVRLTCYIPPATTTTSTTTGSSTTTTGGSVAGCSPTNSGLCAEYRKGANANTMPNPYFTDNTFVIRRTDAVLNLPFGCNAGGGDVKSELNPMHPYWNDMPYRAFSSQWTGQIYMPTSGTYTFYVSHDDGFWIWIDGAVVHSRGSWTGSCYSWITASAGPKAYTAGWHDILIQHVQNPPTDNHIAVQWEATAVGIPRGDIPAANLRPPQ